MSDTKIKKRVLITGGTSGLGLSLAKKFLSEGFMVYASGRKNISNIINNDNFVFVECDFTDLYNVKELGNQLAKTKGGFSFIVNNAGVLSPPEFLLTKNGFELSYQVNFLAHVLLTNLLLSGNSSKPECIVNISSPLYVQGKIEQEHLVNEKNYSVVQAYAQSKLFMALLSEKLHVDENRCFCFNPGTFSSGIYRLQNSWFHTMYKIAAPFMVSSQRVANGLFQILKTKNWTDGKMITKKGSMSDIKNFDPKLKDIFWQGVDAQLESFKN